MNRENILAVADAIEKHSIPDLGFNMGWWKFRFDDGANDKSGHECSTCACIGGWTETVFPGSDASEVLDLRISEARRLFYPHNGNAWSATSAQAAAVLRHLAETGEVYWDKALAEPSK